jgi:hypothetical protein
MSRLFLIYSRLRPLPAGRSTGRGQWHVAPLPPGTPYEEQQFGAFALDRGYLDMSDADLAELADALGRDVARMLEH